MAGDGNQWAIADDAAEIARVARGLGIHVGPEEWEGKAFYETERRTRLGTLLCAVTGAPKRPFGHAFAHLSDLEAYVSSLPRE